MREMKDSGVEWIGQIPKDWDVVPHKRVMHKVKEICAQYNGEDIISLTMNGVIKRDLAAGGKMPTSFDGYQYVKPNDLLLCLFDIDVTPRCVGVVKDYGVTSPAYSRFIMHDGYYNAYYDYLLRAIDDDKVFVHLSKNLRSSLTESDFGAIKTCVPSLAEQERIAAFLDAECAEIDAVLEKTRASIEEYKKLKQAVITQAVTKGIRGDRPMKNSGIEWIGTCPLNWTVCRIKNVIFPQEKEVLPNDEIITCFRDGEVTLRKNRREDGFTVSFTEHGYHGVDKGDLVIHGMDAFAGAIGCSDSRGKTTPVVHTCKTAGNNRFFMYFLRSMAYGNILMDLSNGVRIRSSDFRNFAKLGVFGAVMPPLEEQNEIVDYIDGIVIQMDRLIQKKENLLTEIENYKKSLIYEYVTGKKEVV